MTDQDLLHHLRNSKGWPTLGNAAADRIEALAEEIERLRKRVEALISERDRAAQEARALALQEVRQALRDDLGDLLYECAEIDCIVLAAIQEKTDDHRTD